MITLAQLRQCMPLCPAARAELMLPHLVAAVVEFEINTPLRLSAFVAQIAHESMELRYMEEIATGRAYEGRRDLGNVEVGDGVRFKGRGPIQLTGRFNYRAAGRALGLELEAHPELAARPDVGFRTAGLYWKKHRLNEAADRADFGLITRRINGGMNGWPERVRYYRLARAAFGLEPWEEKNP